MSNNELAGRLCLRIKRKEAIRFAQRFAKAHDINYNKAEFQKAVDEKWPLTPLSESAKKYLSKF